MVVSHISSVFFFSVHVFYRMNPYAGRGGLLIILSPGKWVGITSNVARGVESLFWRYEWPCECVINQFFVFRTHPEVYRSDWDYVL